ncbi:hypothetical protein IM511_01010 [Erythrobacteraceae bacterium E2-1 Yellow Sea]|nr:hypothetical protein [Erythrobacteraceae bacterium E2-1 Yellow Sea]
MAKLGNYADLMAEIEAERLRLREITHRGSYGGEQYLIVTPEFAQRFDEDALIRASVELSRLSPTEARTAADKLETELRIRGVASDVVTRRDVRRTLIAAVAAAIFAFIALFV